MTPGTMRLCADRYASQVPPAPVDFEKRSGHCLLDQHIGQLLLQLAGGGDAGLELIAQRHQLIDFGDDAVLFNSGWQTE